VQLRIAGADGRILGREDAPRRYGELHHRHQRVHLRRADDQLLVEPFDPEKRGELSAADHVGARVGVSQQSCGRHVGDEQLQGPPRVVLVAQTLHDGLSAQFPAGTQLVAGERAAQFGPPLHVAVRVAFGVVVEIRFGLHVGHVPAVELETVGSVFAPVLLEFPAQVRHRFGVRQVVAGAVSVPPPDDRRVAPAGFEQVALPLQFAEFGRVGRDVGGDPEHHAESHGVQRVDHAPRIGEARGLEVEVPVVVLPVVVDHEDSLREAVFDSLAGIAHDVALVLVVHELDPGVVLRHGEEQLGGNRSRGREVGRRGGRIGVAETLSGVHGLECLVVGGEVEPPLLDPEPEGVFGPDVAAFGREQQRHGLVVVVDSREILFGELRRIGHPVSQGDEAAPPPLAGKRLYGLFERGLRCGRRQAGGEQEERKQAFFHSGRDLESKVRKVRR